ncbi:uncharacterized protein MONOS_12988 [Monocercomonoides exilis]|uniref:uncharacterized protein n=1 Tax=Monocercomonoides exilis TaxID=2049356 RepID=UPI00355A0414|nr:hypothetical protein MONOS_12988 [Monocercomonoides exilis]|eukprot:MONOS_12988.1-p1 / transcript=MONOS_12988.1 / gene=MONOS_12988 / organism=Monocercomonoides_exilis_PA203 / gene_product=unspecified product / transcript_product=unspecified product / location=Mono_scaffold00763:14050-14691(-) / protein_length=97 / sequence_SO=supercontig / SO=protein_coding / is_pseudo=false
MNIRDGRVVESPFKKIWKSTKKYIYWYFATFWPPKAYELMYGSSQMQRGSGFSFQAPSQRYSAPQQTRQSHPRQMNMRDLRKDDFIGPGGCRPGGG